jgi:hypothetical protein
MACADPPTHCRLPFDRGRGGAKNASLRVGQRRCANFTSKRKVWFRAGGESMRGPKACFPTGPIGRMPKACFMLRGPRRGRYRDPCPAALSYESVHKRCETPPKRSAMSSAGGSASGRSRVSAWHLEFQGGKIERSLDTIRCVLVFPRFRISD